MLFIISRIGRIATSRKDISLTTLLNGGFHNLRTRRFQSSNSQYSANKCEEFDQESSNSKSSEERSSASEKLEQEFVDTILGNSLKYVNTYGWSSDSIIAGASDASKDGNDATVELASSMFTEDDLVRFFINKSNLELENFLSVNKVNFHDALERRLQTVVPYVTRYNEAIAISMQPKNMVETIRQLQEIADTVAHHSILDKSTNLSWYTKRVGLASIYASTELCLVQDKSNDFMDTWNFLRRRCKEFETMKLDVSVKGKTLPVPELVSVGITTVLNMIRKNSGR